MPGKERCWCCHHWIVPVKSTSKDEKTREALEYSYSCPACGVYISFETLDGKPIIYRPGAV